MTWSRLKNYALANKPAKSDQSLQAADANRFNEYCSTVGQRIAATLSSEPSPARWAGELSGELASAVGQRHLGSWHQH